MSLPSTHISSLTDGGPRDPKDKLQLQRNVLGSWQDFHTDIETYFGEILTATFTWDGSEFWFDQLTVLGKILVPIEVYAIFTPGAAPSGQFGQFLVSPLGGTGGGSLTFEYYDTADAQALSHSFTSPRLGDTLQLSIGGIFGPFSGTTVITVHYVAKDPI